MAKLNEKQRSSLKQRSMQQKLSITLIETIGGVTLRNRLRCFIKCAWRNIGLRCMKLSTRICPALERSDEKDRIVPDSDDGSAPSDNFLTGSLWLETFPVIIIFLI